MDRALVRRCYCGAPAEYAVRRDSRLTSDRPVPTCAGHLEEATLRAGPEHTVVPLKLIRPGERQRADRAERGGTRGSAGERAPRELLESLLRAGNNLASGLIGAFGVDFPGPEVVGIDAGEWFKARSADPKLALLGYEAWIAWRAAILAARALEALHPELEDHVPEPGPRCARCGSETIVSQSGAPWCTNSLCPGDREQMRAPPKKCGACARPDRSPAARRSLPLAKEPCQPPETTARHYDAGVTPEVA